MTLRRGVFLASLRYRGGGPMLSWLLHRISGLAMIIFISGHVLSSFFQHQLGSNFATSLNQVYESVYFQVFIYFVVIFHALNGLRIIILDTWPKMLEYQREMTWLEWLIFLPVYGLAIYVMIMRTLRGG